MRILYLNGHPVWAYGLPWGFRRLGHDVQIVEVIEQDDLLWRMRTSQPDLLVSVGWIDQYIPRKLAAIKYAARRFDCPHVYWATEDINHYDIWVDAQSVRRRSVETLVRPLVDAGYDIVLWGKGWEPLFDPGSEPETTHRYFPELVFLGPGRVQLNHQRGRHVTIPHHFLAQAPPSAAQVNCRGPLPFNKTFHVYKNAKITLNLQNENRFSTQVTSRTFEISGCGGFQLTLHTPAVERLFVHRRHLVMSKSPAETVALVDYYLEHEQERLAIAAAGRLAVLAEHTYDRRAARMLACLDQLLPGRSRRKTGAGWE